MGWRLAIFLENELQKISRKKIWEILRRTHVEKPRWWNLLLTKLQESRPAT